VVVEGSYNGSEWFPLEDGYDSRANTLWETRFNQNMSSGDYPNSTGTGNVTLMKKRSLLINTGVFGSNTGQPMLVRFRLYSDQLTHGWGWTIDNLFIQENAPAILANEEKTGIALYPNPSTDHIDIQMTLSEAQKVQLEIFSLNGGKVYNEYVTAAGTDFNHQIRVAGLPSGNYVLQVKEAKGSVFKRFTKL